MHYDQPQYVAVITDPKCPAYSLPQQRFDSIPEAHAHAVRIARGYAFRIVTVNSCS